MAKQERGERTRETIIQAAARVFEQEGYAAAPMAAITQRATVTKGAVYFHFASKRELAQAVVADARDALDGLVDQVLQRQSQGTEPPLQLLIDFTHAVLLRLATDPVLRAGLLLGADRDLYPGGAAGLKLDWLGLAERLAADAPPGPGAAPAGADGASVQCRLVALSMLLAGLELLIRRHPGQFGAERLAAVWRVLLPGLTRSCQLDCYEPAGRDCGPRTAAAPGPDPASP